MDVEGTTSEAQCSRCQATSSPIWRRNEGGDIFCLDCQSVVKKTEKERADHLPTPPPGKKRGRNNRKGSRAERAKAAAAASAHAQQASWLAGRLHLKGRRSLAKLNTRVSPLSHSLPVLPPSLPPLPPLPPSLPSSLPLIITCLSLLQPMKAPKPEPTIITSDSVIHRVRYCLNNNS